MTRGRVGPSGWSLRSLRVASAVRAHGESMLRGLAIVVTTAVNCLAAPNETQQVSPGRSCIRCFGGVRKILPGPCQPAPIELDVDRLPLPKWLRVTERFQAGQLEGLGLRLQVLGPVSHRTEASRGASGAPRSMTATRTSASTRAGGEHHGDVACARRIRRHQARRFRVRVARNGRSRARPRARRRDVQRSYLLDGTALPNRTLGYSWGGETS